ncbi:hypothetical protein B0T13DRAFT_510506 [Neurospora crassa]|nr:hypothetical protein B0T13DRAFT_510506 [Neurospora crassa]
MTSQWVCCQCLATGRTGDHCDWVLHEEPYSAAALEALQQQWSLFDDEYVVAEDDGEILVFCNHQRCEGCPVWHPQHQPQPAVPQVAPPQPVMFPQPPPWLWPPQPRNNIPRVSNTIFGDLAAARGEAKRPRSGSDSSSSSSSNRNNLSPPSKRRKLSASGPGLPSSGEEEEEEEDEEEDEDEGDEEEEEEEDDNDDDWGSGHDSRPGPDPGLSLGSSGAGSGSLSGSDSGQRKVYNKRLLLVRAGRREGGTRRRQARPQTEKSPLALW